MATRGRKASPGAEDEFLQNLYKGGELLGAGKVIEAKDYLERAYELDSKNEKGQNLLGLTYFKLGLFDRAAEIYEALVRENPVDATLRVNLGLVYLKTNQLQRAIREFETSVDLSPDHKKAHNYLGLALAQIGNYAEAKEHFIEAGSDAMALKMERAMSGEATGLHRMPTALDQQKKNKFAEIEGSEIVAEQGGQQVSQLDERRRAEQQRAKAAASGRKAKAEAAREPEPEVEVAHEQEPAPAPGSASEPESAAEVEVVEAEEAAPASSATARSQQEGDWGSHFGGEEMRFAEDEGPSSAPTSSAASAPSEAEEAHVVMTPEEVGAAAEAEEGFSEDINVDEEPPAAPAAEALEADAEAGAGAESETETAIDVEPAVVPGVAEAEPPGPEQWEARPLSEVETKGLAAGLPLAELAPTLEVLKGAVAGPFEVRHEGVAIVVNGELLSRVDGLLLVSGAVKYEPEMKRFRGRTTDQAFGEGERRMTRATGKGVMIVGAPEKQRFVSVDLAEESAYFREEVVFAFEEAVMFENGRIPSEVTGDMDLVHLRGKGKVLVRIPGALRAHQVRMDEPVTVPLERLVGWFGNVTPKLLTLAVEESGAVVKGGAELSGEGYVLFAVPTA